MFFYRRQSRFNGCTIRFEETYTLTYPVTIYFSNNKERLKIEYDKEMSHNQLTVNSQYLEVVGAIFFTSSITRSAN